MSEYVQVLTTVGREEDAQEISRMVVEKRLAACAQIVGPISSIYWWKGKVEKENEWLCLMKTREIVYKHLEEAVRAAHPYEEPEIIALPIVAGSEGYLKWIDDEVGPSGK